MAGNRGDLEFAAACPAEPGDGRIAQVLVDAMPSSYPAVVIPVIRGKNDWNVRIQFVDETEPNVEPALVTVEVKGTVRI